MDASLVLDIVTLLIFVYAVVTSWRRGFAKSAVELTGYVLSAAVSYVFSAPVGNWLYSTFVKPAVYSQVSGYISGAVSGSTASATATVTNGQFSKFLGNLPAGFANFLSAFGLNPGGMQALANSAAKTAGGDATSLIMTSIVAPVGTSLSRGIAFAALFAICLLVVRLAANAVSAVFKLPGLNAVNRLGGAVLGLLKGAALMLLLTTLIALIVPTLSLQQNPWLNSQVIEHSSVFKILYHMNPVTGILLNRQ